MKLLSEESIKKKRRPLYAFITFSFYFLLLLINAKVFSSVNDKEKVVSKHSNNYLISKEPNKWEILEKSYNSKETIKWEKISDQDQIFSIITSLSNKVNDDSYKTLSVLNRSIIFNEEIIGPDISWLVPLGFIWNDNYKFDSSIRGHNRRKEGEKFFAWNGGDAVGQFHYQFLRKENYSFGLNLGMRSVYKGPNAGGGTSIGEGLSSGFRFDRKLSNSSGIAFGAEQLLHFDGLTDTGRDIYLTASKGWWSKGSDNNNTFPLFIATAGIGTGKMAEGNIKGLCSNLLGGSGTEVNNQRSLCWAPIFSLSKVYNENFSTFFEYNSKWFLLGSSVAPFDKIPLRGTFAVQISDHIDNYKVNNFNELKWVFRLSLGF